MKITLLLVNLLWARCVRSLPSRKVSDESLGRDETSFVRLNQEQCIFTSSNQPIYFFFIIYCLTIHYYTLDHSLLRSSLISREQERRVASRHDISLPWKVKIAHTFKLPFHFFTEKFVGFWQTSFCNRHRKYSWKFRHLKIATLL